MLVEELSYTLANVQLLATITVCYLRDVPLFYDVQHIITYSHNQDIAKIGDAWKYAVTKETKELHD